MTNQYIKPSSLSSLSEENTGQDMERVWRLAVPDEACRMYPCHEDGVNGLRLGDAMMNLSRYLGLSNADIDAMNAAVARVVAEPIQLE